MNASCLATGRLFSPTTGHPLHTQIQLLSTYIDMEMAVRGNRLSSLRLEHSASISSSLMILPFIIKVFDFELNLMASKHFHIIVLQ